MREPPFSNETAGFRFFGWRGGFLPLHRSGLGKLSEKMKKKFQFNGNTIENFKNNN